MVDDELGYDPTTTTGKLRFIIGNLWSNVGQTSIGIGILINTSLCLVGLVAFWLTTGWLSYVALVWAILNILPVIQWVLGL